MVHSDTRPECLLHSGISRRFVMPHWGRVSDTVRQVLDANKAFILVLRRLKRDEAASVVAESAQEDAASHAFSVLVWEFEEFVGVQFVRWFDEWLWVGVRFLALQVVENCFHWIGQAVAVGVCLFQNLVWWEFVVW